MPLSESARNELRTELKTLHQVKSAVDDRIKALEAVLTPFDFGQAGLPFLVRFGENGNSDNEPEPLPIPGTTGETGLRASVLALLREYKRPMRAPEIAKILVQRGFSSIGKTPLSVRIYNDLWRVAEKGDVENDDGTFSLKD